MVFTFQVDAIKVGGPGGAGATSEGVLANFFNSLLSKKTGGAAGSPVGPNGQMAGGPGGSPGGMGSPGGVGGGGVQATGSPQIKATGENDDCEYIQIIYYIDGRK